MRATLSRFLALATVSLFIAILPRIALGQTLTVPDDYSTIQSALDAAVTGDTVYVRSGTYYEHVTIDKSLTLKGENRATTVIDGSGVGKVVTITSTSNVTVRGLTIRNSGTTIGPNQDAGIVLRNASNNLIIDCTITANGLNGFYSWGSSHNTIQNCDFSHNESPPVSGGGVRGAIHIRNGSHNTIADNNIYSNNRNGITARSPADHTTIRGNHIYSNQGHGIHVGHSRHCSIADNAVHDNSGAGVDFDAGSDHRVTNNTLEANRQGIRTVFYSYRDTFIGNVIRENHHGILIGGYQLSSHSHVFYHNDVVQNTVQVWIRVSGANWWDNGYPAGGNYWSDYTGVDSDHDGIGDTPYVINASNGDNYPLMRPWNVLQVAIDIKPGSAPNAIEPRSKGVIAVAILTTSSADGDALDFDAWEVDAGSVAFGPDGARIAHATGHAEDVDADGDLDMVVHFKSQDTGMACGDVEATLTGETFGGQAIEGRDSVRTVGCR